MALAGQPSYRLFHLAEHQSEKVLDGVGEQFLFFWKMVELRAAGKPGALGDFGSRGVRVAAIDQAFTQTYPQAYSNGTSSQQLLADAQTRWQNSLAGFQDAMRVQAGVVQNLDSTRTQIDALITSSQGATGALQAAQSGNQLIGIQTKQLADLTAVMAAIARAQSLEGARNVESQEQAQQQLARFLNYGGGYQPGNVQMFH